MHALWSRPNSPDGYAGAMYQAQMGEEVLATLRAILKTLNARRTL